uniref:G-protein coupled receptors family 1 profile domain-containing protein n=1 Tax=Onchocerca volvulus TaxID=6282 RepID=A0A8R1XKL0_ONCVO
MDFDINETTTEDANTVVNNGSLLLEVVSHILHTYAYLFVGALLILVNIPVFLLVIMHKTLRNFYPILVVASLNSELTGISAISVGVKRAIVSVGGERLIDHHECVLNVFFVVLPSIAEYINLMGTSVVSGIIVMICVYLRLLNSCNMALVFLYLQKDLRSTAIQSFKDRFRGTKDHVQSIKITGFGK